MNTKQNYERVSHTHCWNNENLPCGIPLEKHTQCCLCDLKMPTHTKQKNRAELIEEIVGEFERIFRNKDGRFVASKESLDRHLRQALLRISDASMTDEKIVEEIILEALGEASALFMSQEKKGTEIIMPEAELIRIKDNVLAALKEKRTLFVK